eukprot:363474-Chlamydomonas_euryale.AAC.17
MSGEMLWMRHRSLSPCAWSGSLKNPSTLPSLPWASSEPPTLPFLPLCICRCADVRLTYGSNDYPGSCAQGRLEVRVGGKWGTVCRTAFEPYRGTDLSVENTQAVCRSLGLPWQGAEWVAGGREATQGSPNTSLPINIVVAFCDADSTDFPNDCKVPIGLDKRCTHDEDVKVICKPPYPPPPPLPPSPPSPPPSPPMPPSPPSPSPPSPFPPADQLVRFAGGNKQEGRLELFFPDKWGTMCYTSTFSNSVAKAVCRQMGREVFDDDQVDFGYSGSRYGEADLPVVATFTFCPLNKEAGSLTFDCEISSANVDRCTHDRDVWVRCPR